jgi:hypothetical protein
MNQWPKALCQVKAAGGGIARIIAFFAKGHQDHVTAAKANGLILRHLHELCANPKTMLVRGDGHPPDLKRSAKMQSQGHKTDAVAGLVKGTVADAVCHARNVGRIRLGKAEPVWQQTDQSRAGVTCGLR